MVMRLALISAVSILSLLFVLAPVPPAFPKPAAVPPPTDRHYVTVFSYQSDPRLPHTSHTFAVFTKAGGEKSSSREKIEDHTISWLPSSLNVDIANLTPEPGTNFDLPTTLELARKQNLRVSVWGPFRIKEELFHLAQRRIEQLSKGELRFMSFDLLAEKSVAVNCIHALSDLDSGKPGLYTGAAHGESASKLVVEHLRPWFVEAREDIAWLQKRLDLHTFAAGN